MQEQHPACFCSAGMKADYECTTQGQNRNQLVLNLCWVGSQGSQATCSGFHLTLTQNTTVSVTGTRWHKTIQCSTCLAGSSLPCLEVRNMELGCNGSLPSGYMPSSCGDAFLQGTESPGPKRPLTLLMLSSMEEPK